MARKIVVVNDSPDFVDMVDIILEGEGYEVRSCSEGRQAIAVIREWRPDLVLLDIRMEGLSGWETLDRLNADPQTSGVRVLVTSGAVEEIAEARHRLRGQGHDFIPLPFELDEFLDKVHELAGSPD